ncbi:MAG: DMT family transporter [Brumimicrobium sp.]|nr:DMT family transporter [Brumimicrobium sp.]
MIYLLLSIFFSTFILIIFRMFKRFEVNTFQAIVFNYLVAFAVGFLFFGKEWQPEHLHQGTWIPFAFIIGALFIGLFLLMGKSSQENGIGITSVAVKMSLAIPVTAAIFLYHEHVYLSKILGIIGALVGVFLITFQKKSARKKGAPGNVLFLVILFVGSGLLDTLLNYVERIAAGDLSLALFSAIGFGIAGVIGLFVLSAALIMKKQQLRLKNIFGGLILGIPNFFSIYFLLMAVRNPEVDDSVTYALNNVGIVMASFIVGIIAFKESTTPLKIIGGIVSVIAIFLLTL